jgi:NAD(P)-dependent dehydrogenase (short-subunit alcohol dehydrogenase family)
MQFATNHLGHFQLTARLYPALKKANGARVVCLSSYGHSFAPFDFDDWNFLKREYEPWKSYGQSKTANILFGLQLDKKRISDNIRAFSVHPGVIITTELSRFQSSNDIVQKMGLLDADLNPVINPLKQWKTVQMGASTTVWCATSPLLEGKGGVYCENNNITSLMSSLVDQDPQSGCDAKGFCCVKDYAIDSIAAEKLWKLSEELTGITF